MKYQDTNKYSTAPALKEARRELDVLASLLDVVMLNKLNLTALVDIEGEGYIIEFATTSPDGESIESSEWIISRVVDIDFCEGIFEATTGEPLASDVRLFGLLGIIEHTNALHRDDEVQP